MTKDLWINLPVKNIKRSKEFFTALGCTFNDRPGQEDIMTALIVGDKKIVVMLFQEDTFKSFIQTSLADTANASEVMFSFSAESRDEVDELAKKVTAAGGNLFAPPSEIQGWMYGCAFSDLDGHRWNSLYMDMSKQQ